MLTPGFINRARAPYKFLNVMSHYVADFFILIQPLAQLDESNLKLGHNTMGSKSKLAFIGF